MAQQKINTEQIANLGGVAIGFMDASTFFGSTGNKSVTGLGFKPRLVEFSLMPIEGSNTAIVLGGGGMSPSKQYAYSYSIGTESASRFSNSSTSLCIGRISTAGTSFSMSAEYVSMDDDGFTINVITASTGAISGVEYKAYA